MLISYYLGFIHYTIFMLLIVNWMKAVSVKVKNRKFSSVNTVKPAKVELQGIERKIKSF